MKCPKCPYYEQKTSYGVELIKCNNKCERKAETMTRKQAIAHGKEQLDIFGGEHREFIEMAINSLQAWEKFKQALDKRIIDQGFDEDEWSISYNELIKMMKKCGGIE